MTAWPGIFISLLAVAMAAPYPAVASGGAHEQLPVIRTFPLPWGSHPTGIITGPDGNLWFTITDNNEIGMMRRGP